MRSFIKLHRKYEPNSSEQSDLEIDIIAPALNSKNHTNTPTSSPTLHHNLQFTPPQISNSTLSSPKKLLTPIKNLFSSNSNVKTSLNPPVSSDNLNSVITGKTKVNRREEAIASETVGFNLAESNKRITKNNKFYKVSGGKVFQDGKYISSKELKVPMLAKTDETNKSKDEVMKNTHVNSESELLSPYSHGNKSVMSNSTVSLGSENKFSRKVSFKSPEKHKKVHKDDLKNSGNEYNSNEEVYESDSSSQFSFVRDKRGGRNTSVKYYKTQKIPGEINDNIYFDQYNVSDAGFGESDLSDYDFENNGFEEFSDDNLEPDQGLQYNKLFHDDNCNCDLDFGREITSSYRTNDSIDTSKLNANLLGDERSSFSDLSLSSKLIITENTKFKVFNKSYHLSIEGIDEVHETFQEPTNKLDILENYLEIRDVNSPPETKSTYKSRETLDYSSSENLQLFDLNSPLINGLTIGNNLRHRSSGVRSYKPKEESVTRNNLFIHRHITMDESLPSSSINSKSDNIIRKTLSSFHSSISDDLIFRIQDKVKEFVNFTDNHNTKILSMNEEHKNSIGLGIFSHQSSSLKHEENAREENNSELEASILEDSLDEDSSRVESPKVDTNSNIINTLVEVELNSSSTVDESQKDKKTNRKSIDNMMSALASLELNSCNSMNKRVSIDNMMNTLKSLEIPNIKISETNKSHKVTDREQECQEKSYMNLIHTIPTNTNRYSWIEYDEYSSFSTTQKELNKRSLSQRHLALNENDSQESDYEIPDSILSEELIDEINTLPEDFDFEEHERKQYQIATLVKDTTYHRSNSFLKKPVKAIIENKYSSTKIETSHKTVTFYRSNSCNSDFDRSRSISRAASVLSSDSTKELKEEEESESFCNQPSYKKKNTVPDIDIRETSNFHRSFDSLTKHSTNLVTISEADSPRVIQQ